MKKYKLIAFDMDGTLLNSQKKISENTALAIREASKSGMTVVICTGRCPAELKEYMCELPFVRYYICTSGALIYDAVKKKILYSDTIDSEALSRILDIACMEDTFLQFMTAESVIQSSYLDKMDQYQMGVYHDLYEHVTTRVPDIVSMYRQSRLGIGKFNIYHRDTDARLRTKSRIEKENLPVELTFSEITSLEVSPLNVNKGTGLVKLCSHLGIDPGESVAVGDAYNDLPMINAAGLGVAMGNSNDTVKAAADIIVSDNDHDGCTEILRLIR